MLALVLVGGDRSTVQCLRWHRCSLLRACRRGAAPDAQGGERACLAGGLSAQHRQHRLRRGGRGAWPWRWCSTCRWARPHAHHGRGRPDLAACRRRQSVSLATSVDLDLRCSRRC
ncbi:hypothetical protein ACU4GD_23150 [Cupriavidus basilensis]